MGLKMGDTFVNYTIQFELILGPGEKPGEGFKFPPGLLLTFGGWCDAVEALKILQLDELGFVEDLHVYGSALIEVERSAWLKGVCLIYANYKHMLCGVTQKKLKGDI